MSSFRLVYKERIKEKGAEGTRFGESNKGQETADN
jgi:hypothetical protein